MSNTTQETVRPRNRGSSIGLSSSMQELIDSSSQPVILSLNCADSVEIDASERQVARYFATTCTSTKRTLEELDDEIFEPKSVPEVLGGLNRKIRIKALDQLHPKVETADDSIEDIEASSTGEPGQSVASKATSSSAS